MPAMISRFALAALALAGGFGTAMGSTVEEEANAYFDARAADGSCPEIAKETLEAQRSQCPSGAHSWVSEAADPTDEAADQTDESADQTDEAADQTDEATDQTDEATVECGRQVSVNGASRVSRYNSESNTCDDCVGGYDESNGNNGDCEEYTYCGNQLPVGDAAPVSRLTGVTPTTGPGSCAPCNTGSHDLTDANNNDCVAGPTCGNTYVLDTETSAYKAVSRLEPGADSRTAGRCVDCDYGHFGPLDNDNNAPDCKCNVRTACNLGEPERCASHRSAEDYDAGCARTDSVSGKHFLIKGASPGTFTKIEATEQVPANYESSDHFISLEEAYGYSWSPDCYDADGKLSLYVTKDWKAAEKVGEEITAGDEITCMKNTDSGSFDAFSYAGGNNNYNVDQSKTLNRWVRVQELCESGHGLSTGEYDDSGALLRPVCKPSVDCVLGDAPTIENCDVDDPKAITQSFTPAQYGGDDSCSADVVTEHCAPVNCALGPERTRGECTEKNQELVRQVTTQPNILGTACNTQDPIICAAGDGTPPNTVPGEPCVVGWGGVVDAMPEGTDCERCGILLQDVITEAEINGEACPRLSYYCKTGDGPIDNPLQCPMQEDELESGMVLLRKSGNNYDIPRWFKIYGGDDGHFTAIQSWDGQEYTGFKIQYCQTPDHICDAGATTHLGVGGPGEGHGFAYNYFPDGTGDIGNEYWTAGAAKAVTNCVVETDVNGNNVFYKNGAGEEQVFKKQWLQSWTVETWEILKADDDLGTGLYMLSSAGSAKGCPEAIHVKGCSNPDAGNYDTSGVYGVTCCGVSSWVEGTDGISREVHTACDASFCGNQANGDSRYDVTSYTLGDSAPYDTTLTSSSENYGSREEKTLSIHILTMVDTPTYKVVTTRDSGTTETSPQNLQVGLNSITVAEDFQNGHRTVKVQFSRGDITYSELLINGEGARADGHCADCASGTWAFTSADDCVSYTTCGTQTNGDDRAPTLLDPDSTDKLFVCAACADGTWADSGGQNCQTGNSKYITSGFCTDFPGWRIATVEECTNGDLAFTGPGRPFWNIFSYTPSISSSGALGCIKVDGGYSADRIYYNDGNYGSLDSSNVECGATHEDGGNINFLGCLCVRDDFTYVPSVDCEGGWTGTSTDCDAAEGETGERTRAFVITTQAQGNGADCAANDGETRTEVCVTFDSSAPSITLENVQIGGQSAFANTGTTVTNAGFPEAITLTTEADGAGGHSAQILTIYVDHLPAGGASYRVYKTLGPSGNSDTSGAVTLYAGENAVYVDPLEFNRVVKIQFSSADIEISGLALNNVVQPISDASAAGGDAATPTSTPVKIDDSNAFTAGPSAWPKVLVATTVADGAASQGAQTFTMNVVKLPDGGANYRVAKIVANGNWNNGNAVGLTLGENSITVAGVSFDRAVKFQFSKGDVEFDALSVNGQKLYPETAAATSTLDYCPPSAGFDHNANMYGQFEFVVEEGNRVAGELILRINVVSDPYGTWITVVEGAQHDYEQDHESYVQMVLGLNTITVPDWGYPRSVKFLFDDNTFEFSSLTVNGGDPGCSYA